MRKVIFFIFCALFTCNVIEAENICDTVKARQMILDFYKTKFSLVYDTAYNRSVEDTLMSYLTPEMYAKLGRINNATDCSNIIRTEDTSGYELQSLQCHHLNGNWYMVSFQHSKDANKINIPTKVSANANGQLKISYIVPIWGGVKYGDKMFEIADVKVKDNKTALAMVTTFFEKYARTYALLSPTLDDDLATLRKTYCTDNMLAKFQKERDNEEYEGRTGYDAIIGDYDFDALWYPQLQFFPVNPAEVLIKFNGKTLRANVVKKDGRYLLDDINEINL